MNNIRINCHINGIQKILLNLQNKHKNARYNPMPFEKTQSLFFAYRLDDNKKKKCVMTDLVGEDCHPDVNFGINSICYAVLKKNDETLFGKLDHQEFINKINFLYTDENSDSDNNYKIIKKNKVKDNFLFPVDVSLEKGESLLFFINFYYFLDKQDNPSTTVNMKMTCYMARFDNIQNPEPFSMLQKISKKQTRYETRYEIKNENTKNVEY